MASIADQVIAGDDRVMLESCYMLLLSEDFSRKGFGSRITAWLSFSTREHKNRQWKA
jgi:hypothetical protein